MVIIGWLCFITHFTQDVKGLPDRKFDRRQVVLPGIGKNPCKPVPIRDGEHGLQEIGVL